MGANNYIIQGFYPNDSEFRIEINANDLRDSLAAAQGLLKVTTLTRVYVIDGTTGEKLAYYCAPWLQNR